MSKFYYKKDGVTYSINLQANFGNYFHQADTNCDKIGVAVGTVDSGYRVHDSTGIHIIYASNSFSWYIEKIRFDQVSSSSCKISEIWLSKNMEANTQVNCKIEEISGGAGESGSYSTQFNKTYTMSSSSNNLRNIWTTADYNLDTGGYSSTRYRITITITDTQGNQFTLQFKYLYFQSVGTNLYSFHTGKVLTTNLTERDSTSSSSLTMNGTTGVKYDLTTGAWSQW